MADRAAFPPGEAREDWAILRALSDVLGQQAALRLARRAARRRCSRRIRISRASTRSRPATPADIAQARRRSAATPDKAPFRSPIDDFYLTNPIARASAVMAECSALAEGRAAMTAAE